MCISRKSFLVDVMYGNHIFVADDYWNRCPTGVHLLLGRNITYLIRERIPAGWFVQWRQSSLTDRRWWLDKSRVACEPGQLKSLFHSQKRFAGMQIHILDCTVPKGCKNNQILTTIR